MILTIIAPVSERRLRLNSELTPSQIRSALAFDPNCGKAVDAEGKVLFEVSVKDVEPTQLGRYGLSIAAKPGSQKIEHTFTLSAGSEEEFYAGLARAAQHLPVIEKQINTALEAFTKAKSAVKAV